MREQEREAMSIHETVQTEKWYYLCNTRSAYFPIDRRLHSVWERARERAREREAMSIHETVKTEKWYYLCNTRSAYFPIDRRLHRERDTHRERQRERRERLCPPMRLREHRNGTISRIQDLHISLLMRLHREREREGETERKRERGYVHP